MNVRFARVLAAALALLGAWYAARGLWVLVTLSSVTNAWIVASGDADFRFDYELFVILIGTGACFMTVLGGSTLYLGSAFATRRQVGRDYWSLIVFLAFTVHLFMLPYKAVETGRMGREAGMRYFLTIAAWFAVVCGAYTAVWIIARVSERRGVARALGAS